VPSVTGLGPATRPRGPLADRAFAFLASYALAMGVAQIGCVALGLARVVMSRAVGVAVLAAACAAGFAYWRRLVREEAGAQPPVSQALRDDAFAWWVAAATIVVAGVIYGLSWIAVLAKPDFSWDGNTYHIPTIHEWMRRGFIHWVTFDYDPGPGWTGYVDLMINDYPKAAETVGFLLSGALGSSHPVNASNLVFFPLGVAGAFVTARTFGASRAAAWTAGAGLGLVPIFVTQGVTAYVDAALADSVGAEVGILSAIVVAVQRDRLPWIAAPAAGAVIGLTAGCKGSGLSQALLGVAAVAAVCAWRAWREPRPSRLRSVAQGAMFVAWIAATALLVAGYWYGRNYVFKGNPMAPVRVTLLGHTLFPGVPVTDIVPEEALTPDIMRPWPGWKRVAFVWLQGAMQKGHEWPDTIRWCGSIDGGLGYLWTFACLPAILFVAYLALPSRAEKDATTRVPAAAFSSVVAVIALSFLVLPMNWWSRYSLWVCALGFPCLAVAIDHAGRLRRRAVKFALRGWLVLWLCVAVFEGLYAFYYAGFWSGFLARRPLSPTPAGLWSALTTYDHPKYMFAGMTPLGVEAVTGPDAVALGNWSVVDGPLLGVLSMPVGLREIVFLSPEIASDEARLRALLDAHQVRFVFWRDDETTPAAVVKLSTREERTEGFWRVYEMKPPRAIVPDIRPK
jgi:hypothetical protein